MTIARAAPIATLLLVCLLLAAASTRTLLVSLALPPSVAAILDPSFEDMAFAPPGAYSQVALTAADALHIQDRRLEAARVSGCLHQGGTTTCRAGLDRAASLAPFDPEIPLMQIQFDQAAGALDQRTDRLAASCALAQREAWVAMRRLPYMIALDTAEFAGRSDCFSGDVATLLRSTRYLDGLADAYVAWPHSRERIREAVGATGGPEARWFVTRIRDRTDRASTAAN